MTVNPKLSLGELNFRFLLLKSLLFADEVIIFGWLKNHSVTNVCKALKATSGWCTQMSLSRLEKRNEKSKRLNHLKMLGRRLVPWDFFRFPAFQERFGSFDSRDSHPLQRISWRISWIRGHVTL